MTRTPALGSEALAAVQALQRCSDVHYDFGLDLVDATGMVLRALKPLTGSGQAAVSRDSTKPVSGRIDLMLDEELVWGRDLIAPYQLVSSPQYSGGEAQRFLLGVYVATTPNVTLRDHELWSVVGYGLPYLLQGGNPDTFAAREGTLYADGVASALDLAGIPGVKDMDGHLNPAVVTYPADWAAKVVPVGKPMIFPNDDSNSFTFLDIVNQLLDASGMQPIYDDQVGNFVITPIPKPQTQASLWTFSQGATGLDDDFARNEAVVEAVYNTDVWNLPNRLVFIQAGLSFEPVADDGSDGRYVINNTMSDPAHYRPPSDQDTIGRVITQVTRLNASGTDDLIKQSEKAFTDLFASAESFDLTTAPWPVAWQFDVFNLASPLLPRADRRKVQAQSWTLPLRGEKMTWHANAVSESVSE